jgi:hypothetical protein
VKPLALAIVLFAAQVAIADEPVGTASLRIFPYASVGTVCAEARFAESCLFAVRVGIELKAFDLHVGGLVGGAPHLPIGGVRAGGGFGTPYFKLTRARKEGSPYVLYLAVRNTVDVDFVGQGHGFTNFVFSHGIGPIFAFGLTRHLRLFANLGVGFSVVSDTNTNFPKLGSLSNTRVDFAFDGAVGLQFLR